MKIPMAPVRGWRRAGVAVLAVAAAVALRAGPLSAVADRAPFLTFTPAIILAALYGGMYAGFLATALSGVAVTYWLEPRGELFTIRNSTDAIAFAVFVLSGVVLSLICEAMHRAGTRAAAAEAQSTLGAERQRADEAIERYELLALHCRDIILFVRKDDGRILECNEAAEAAYGRTREELCTLTIHDIRMPGDRMLTQWQMDVADTSGALFETVHRRKDGSTFPVEVSSSGSTIGGERVMLSVVRDITRRKQAEGARRISEANTQAILDAATESIWLFSRDGVILGANQTAAQRLRTTPAEVIGKRFEEVLSRELAERRWTHLRKVVDSGQPLRFEDEREGLAFAHAFYPVFDDGGKVDRVAAFSRDITESRRAEETIREAEARYRTMFDTMLEGFCIIEVLFDANGRCIDYRFLEVNPAFETHTGLSDAQGKRMKELAPDHEGTWFEIYGRVASTGDPARFVNEAKALARWFDVSAYRIGGEGSHNVAILFSDITEARRAELALSASEARYRDLAESIPAMVWAANSQGVTIDHNRRWEEYTGQTPGQALGDGWKDIIHPDDVQEVADRWAQAVRNMEDYSIEYRIRRDSDGAYRWHSVQAVLRKDEQGDPLGWFGTCIDIEDLKVAQNEAVAARDRFHLALSRMTFAALLLNRDGTIDFANQAFCDMFDLKRSPLDLQTLSSPEILEMIRPAYADPDEAVDHIVDIVNQGVLVQDEEVKMVGERTYLRDFIPLNVDANSFGRLWLHKDITRRKRAEAALAESEQRLRFHLENSPLAVVEWDEDFVVTQWSREAERIFGWAAEEVIGRRIDTLNLVFPEDLPTVERTMDRLTSGAERTVVSSNRNYTKSGGIIECTWYNSVLLNDAGHMTSVLSLVEDITERRCAEEALRASNEELALFNQAMVGRELRMIELKKEINRLCIQAGRPARFEVDLEEVRP